MSWFEEVHREVLASVAAMPPKLRCAAARSGTKYTINEAAWAAHADGSCGCWT